MTRIRIELLSEAMRLVSQDRNNTYGPPHQDFTRIAGILTAMGFRINDEPISSWHVAMIQIALKMSRLVWSPLHRDNWVDIAGYAACGAEAAVLTTEDTMPPEPLRQGREAGVTADPA